MSRGLGRASRVLVAVILAATLSACHSGEKHSARERMRKVFEGITRVGNPDHAVCLWAHGSIFCPGGAEDFGRSATEMEAAFKEKGIDSWGDVKSFEVGEATYKRGDGGMFKISAVVEVVVKINGSPFVVELIDGEPAKWVNCADCAPAVGAAAVAAAPAPASAAAPAAVAPVRVVRPTPTPTPRPVLDGPALFAMVSPSVLVVEAFDKRGRKIKQGSAVSVEKNAAITNWHVVSKAASIKILKGKEKLDATLDAVLEDRDLARLRTTVELQPVSVAKALPNIGETTFALGAPFGFDLTISEGILSGKREDETEKTEYLQTTAAISSGSSGGGLFNAQGELIGITTLQVRPAQNLNFALPAPYVTEIMALPPGSLPEVLVSVLEKLKEPDRRWLRAFVRNLVAVTKDFRYSALEADRALALIASLGTLEPWQKEALRFELGGGILQGARAYWEDAIDSRTFGKFTKSPKRLRLERTLLKRGLITEAEIRAGDEMMENIAQGRDLVLEGATLVADERVLAYAMETVARREALLERVLWKS